MLETKKNRHSRGLWKCVFDTKDDTIFMSSSIQLRFTLGLLPDEVKLKSVLDGGSRTVKTLELQWKGSKQRSFVSKGFLKLDGTEQKIFGIILKLLRTFLDLFDTFWNQI